MRPGLDALRAYYAGADGRRTARLLAQIVAPAVRTDASARLLALGYPAPLLQGLDPARVERLCMVMPTDQGARAWPRRGPSCAVSAHETALPFVEALFDQALLVHALEFADPPKLLRELWRVLAPAGELILIVPNRAGVWTHFESTPFGQGQPYGRNGLGTLLREAMFEPIAWKTALVAPPVRGLKWLDRPLTRLLPALGGIHFVLARKTDGLAISPVGRAHRASHAGAAARQPAPDLPREPHRRAPPRP